MPGIVCVSIPVIPQKCGSSPRIYFHFAIENPIMANALPFMEPLHVVGAGSIGLFFASSIRLAFPSYPLALIFRGHHRETKRFSPKEEEVVVCTRQVQLENTPTNRRRGPQLSRVPYQFLDDEHHNAKIRNLLLCTKAYQAEIAIRDIQHRLEPSNLKIMLLCNGALDAREKVVQRLQETGNDTNLDMIMCTTTHGVINETVTSNSDDDVDDEMFHLLHVGLGRTYMGSGHECTQSLAQLLDQSGLNAQSIETQQMEVLLWQKLAANCVCNPLTALWNVPNGKMHENPSFHALRKQIVNEVSTVGSALHPELQEELGPSSLNSFVEQVIQANLLNQSSMARDIMKQQRTEVENLNGYIVRKSFELGLGPTPANEELLERIKEIHKSYL
jgi:2-dehydropantoate 2-reductase